MQLSGYTPELRDGDLQNIADAKAAIRYAAHSQYVNIRCYNKEEVEAYKKHFTLDELRHIKFTWLHFGMSVSE